MKLLVNFSSQQKKEMVFFISIALLFVLPIIFADIYYRDDLYRIMVGHYGWDRAGRPLASVFAKISTISPFSHRGLLDSAPLTQIVAAVFLGLSGFTFNEYLKREYKQGVLWASVLIVINPFFIENLSYRYDSTGMSLSLFLVVIAFYLKEDKKLGYLASVVILIASLSLYQSSINLFLGLASVEVLILSKTGTHRAIVSKLLMRCSQFVVGYLIYFLTVAQIYVGDRPRTSLVEFNLSGLENIVNNIREFIAVSALIFTPVTELYFSLILLLAVCVGGVFFFTSRRQWRFLVPVSLSLFVYFISLFGPLVLLETPLANFRTIPSLYTLIVSLVILSSFGKANLSFIGVIPLLVALNISFQYGVAEKNQRDYDENLFTLVQYDLLSSNIENNDIYVLGVSQTAPHSELIKRMQPIVNRLSQPVSLWMAASLLIEKGMSHTKLLWDGQYKALASTFESDLCTGSAKIEKENSMYSIYTVQDRTYVLLTEPLVSFCEKSR